MGRKFKWRGRSRGQALVEFAIVLPVLMLLLGAIIQFGLIFWAQNTLTQVVRDTGRWEATVDARPCDTSATRNTLVAKADSIAQASSLIGYSAGLWSTSTLYAYPTSPAPVEGIEVGWSSENSSAQPTDCPPTIATNDTAWFVDIRGHHVVPLFFPFIGNFIPSCTASGCSLSASVEFRMEPAQ